MYIIYGNQVKKEKPILVKEITDVKYIFERYSKQIQFRHSQKVGGKVAFENFILVLSDFRNSLFTIFYK